jgi:hypothetical protein
MNYLEGLRRLTVIISVAVAILTIAFFLVVDNSARQEYSRLMNTVKEIRLQKEQLLANGTDFIKNYVDGLKKESFQDLKIITVKDAERNSEFTILWHQNGLPQEDDIDSLIKNSFYLEGTAHEKETARKLLGYLAGLNDLKAIDSQLSRTKAKMYFVPVIYGAGSFVLVWLIFYCIRYVALGFKKEKA